MLFRSMKPVHNLVWGRVWNRVYYRVRGRVRDRVGDRVYARIRDQVRDQVWDQVWDQVLDQVRDQVVAVSYWSINIHFKLGASHWFGDFLKLGVMPIFVGGKIKFFGKKGKYLGEYDEKELFG